MNKKLSFKKIILLVTICTIVFSCFYFDGNSNVQGETTEHENAQLTETDNNQPLAESNTSSSQTTPVNMHRYVKVGSNIRQSPNGPIITCLEHPIYVRGTMVGNWFRHSYNGQTAYVAELNTQTEAPYYSGYLKTSTYVRKTPGGEIFAIAAKGTHLSGTMEREYLKVSYNGQTGYVFISQFQRNPILISRYVKAGSNIRQSPNGPIITCLEHPIYVRGTMVGNWFRHSYNGQTAYVAELNTQTEAPYYSGYLKTSAYVRKAPGGEMFAIAAKGTRLSGTMERGYLKVSYKGQTGYVFIPQFQRNPILISRYVKAGSIIRQSPNGPIIARLEHPIYVRGTIVGNWFRHTLNGQTAYVAKFNTQTEAPYYSGYLKTSAYVRKTPGGEMFTIAAKGTYLSGTMERGYLKVSYNGQTGYVFIPQFQRNPVVNAWSFAEFSYRDGTLYVNDSADDIVSSRYVGGNHVLVSLSHQYMWVFNYNKLVTSSPIISGKPITPTVIGNFYVNYKQRNTNLVGPTWNEAVAYWAPFYNGYGIHDASWQPTSGFYMNSDTYQYRGSHGCVNVPPANMPAVFNNISPGTPVTVVR